MRSKPRFCGQLQNHVWIANFRRSNWKIIMLGKKLSISSPKGASHLGRGGHLTGKRGISQVYPLRVTPGVPSDSGWGPRALYKAMMRSTFKSVWGIRLRGRRIIESDCMTLGRDGNSCLCRSGHSLLTVSTELVVSSKTTTLLATCPFSPCCLPRLPHLLAARLRLGRSVGNCLSRRLWCKRMQNWMPNCSILTSVGDRGLRTECAQRMSSERRQFFLI